MRISESRYKTDGATVHPPTGGGDGPAVWGDNRTLHVLTLTPFFPLQGDEARGCFIAEPLELMPQLGVRPTVMAVQPVYSSDLGPNASAVSAHRVSYLALPGNIGLASAGIFLYRQIRAAVHRLHREKPIDLIHAHTALPCGHAAARLAAELEIPFVVSVHGLDAFATRQVHGLPGRWVRSASRRVYGSARCVICVSERVKQSVMEGITDNVNCHVVYNGVDPTRFTHAANDEDQGAIILSVGNLDPIKGHELVVRAVAALKNKHPRIRCEIVGTGPELPRLISLVHEIDVADRVTFFSRMSRQEVAARMQQCTVFVLPSSFEALGCVYLEAMASAKPAIGCTGQGIGEIIRHAENGWLIRPHSLPDLVEGLSSLLDNPALRRRIGELGRRTVLESLTLAHQAEGWVRVYRECTA